MPKEFAVEAHHAFMFVPFHEYRAILAASALSMYRRRCRIKEDIPFLFPEAHAQIQILTMKKVSLIPRSYIILRNPAYQHECSRNCFNGNRGYRQWLTVQIEVVK